MKTPAPITVLKQDVSYRFHIVSDDKYPKTGQTIRFFFFLCSRSVSLLTFATTFATFAAHIFSLQKLPRNHSHFKKKCFLDKIAPPPTSLGIKDEEDEDAEGGRGCVEHQVPQQGRAPVGGRVHAYRAKTTVKFLNFPPRGWLRP